MTGVVKNDRENQGDPIMSNGNHHHRSALKQKNKPFKGGSGRSKSRGRVESQAGRPTSGVAKPGRTLNASVMTKADRKNKATLIQAARRVEIQQERKMFSGKFGAPRNILVLSMSPSVNLAGMMEKLVKQEQIQKLEENFCAPNDFVTFEEQQKQRLRWISMDLNKTALNICAILDGVSAADVVVFVASGRDEPMLEPHFEELMAVIRSQGLSSALALIQDASILTKQQKAAWQHVFDTQLPTISKTFHETESFGEDRESSEMIRSLCTQKINGISWRERRPYLLVDGPVQYDASTGIMKLSGYGRGGQPFSANRLIHLQGFGTFALDRIQLSTLVPAHQANNNSMSVDCMEQISDPSKAESVNPEMVNEDSSMMSEDEDQFGSEMKDVAGKDLKTKRKVKVPKGTSSYQAAWMAEEDLIEVSEAEEQEEVELSDKESIASESEAEEEDSNMITEDDPYEKEAHKINSRLLKDFPDRMDIPDDQSGRARFSKYRGLQSLRSSYWDPEEGLPAEYNRIWQFENIARSQQKALNTPSDSPFLVGQRITLFVKDVPQHVAETLHNSTAPVLIFGLLPHEQKTSVLHFTVVPRASPLIHKEPVVAWLGGFRRYTIQPIYSENNLNAKLHKMIRMIEPGMHGLATIYAPIHYANAPALLFSPTTGRLLSVGSVSHPADPRRTILKRITLTGAPYKVHKRTAVVRWMFDSPEDVAWFKPVELCTKSGRRGNIKESLGTHGHFKSLFDKPLLSNEPIAMHLYKRAFPKWDTTKLLPF